MQTNLLFDIPLNSSLEVKANNEIRFDLQEEQVVNVNEIEVFGAEEIVFERKDVEIGISDGVNVEIVSGLTEDDLVKQWNKTEPIKKGEEDEEGEETEE